jgi:hypothetical protein
MHASCLHGCLIAVTRMRKERVSAARVAPSALVRRALLQVARAIAGKHCSGACRFRRLQASPILLIKVIEGGVECHSLQWLR